MVLRYPPGQAVSNRNSERAKQSRFGAPYELGNQPALPDEVQDKGVERYQPPHAIRERFKHLR